MTNNEMLKPYIENVKECFRNYRIALKDYIYESYITDAGELEYPIRVADKLNIAKERYEEAARQLHVMKNILNFEKVNDLVV